MRDGSTEVISGNLAEKKNSLFFVFMYEILNPFLDTIKPKILLLFKIRNSLWEHTDGLDNKHIFCCNTLKVEGLKRVFMVDSVLKGSKTHNNLKAAFAGESQANRRYEYFALKADQEGFANVAELFRSTARGETSHAFRHLDFLSQVGDPITDLPIRSTEDNLTSSVAGERYEYQDMYPGMAKIAREEGFEEIANWFDVLAKAERIHATGFEKALIKLREEGA